MKTLFRERLCPFPMSRNVYLKSMFSLHYNVLPVPYVFLQNQNTGHIILKYCNQRLLLAGVYIMYSCIHLFIDMFICVCIFLFVCFIYFITAVILIHIDLIY